MDQSHDDVFPERTCSMVSTLEEMRAKLSVEGKVFLVAGLEHLEQFSENPLHSLQPLRDFMQGKKIAILKPKCLGGTL